MIKRKTVFVVGAGASCEVGLPTGQELRSKIAEALNILFPDGYQQQSGSRLICQAIQQYCQQSGLRDINPFLKAGWTIRDAAPLALSIDNFIDAHREDKKIEMCGKLAIAETILHAERRCKLFYDRHDSDVLRQSKLSGTWYPKLVQLLTEGVDKSNCRKVFENVVFIIFNYDRCIEHYLNEAMRTYYALEKVEANELIGQGVFIHPYGTVGQLDWQARDGISFGAEVGSSRLLDISNRLRTFTEQVADEAALHGMTAAIESADRLVFLGFAFHEQNMELLKASPSHRARQVFATALGMSKSDCEAVTSEICNLYHSNQTQIKTEIGNDMKCVDLFDQFWRSLRSA